jgi:hypothetical protein
LVEILLLSGGTPYANFKDLAYGWGREKGFHHVLASSVCERRGEVERKRRCDAGKVMSNEQREAFRQKLKRTRAAAVSDDTPNTTTTTTTTGTGTTTAAGATTKMEEEEEVHAMEEDDVEEEVEEDEDAATVQV